MEPAAEMAEVEVAMADVAELMAEQAKMVELMVDKAEVMEGMAEAAGLMAEEAETAGASGRPPRIDRRWSAPWRRSSHSLPAVSTARPHTS